MKLLLIGALLLVCTPVMGQIACNNADAINCGFDPSHGWIVNGSAPRQQERPRLPTLPPPEPYSVSAEEIKRLFHDVPIPPSAIAAMEKMMDRHRLVLAQWELRRGLPSDNAALYAEIIKMKRESEENIIYRMGYTTTFPAHIRAWFLTTSYVAAIAKWEQGVEASVDGTDLKVAKQLLTDSVGYLNNAAFGLAGVPTTNATLAAREFAAFWIRADESRQLRLAANSEESGIYIKGPWASHYWVEAVRDHAGRERPVNYDLIGSADRIEELVKAKIGATVNPSKGVVKPN